MNSIKKQKAYLLFPIDKVSESSILLPIAWIS